MTFLNNVTVSCFLREHLGKYILDEVLYVKVFKLSLGRWGKPLCPKIGNNEVLANESSPLAYAHHAVNACTQGP